MKIENKSLKHNPIYKKFYYLHKSMMNRCYLKSNSSYKYYGAKGVTVDESWHSFDNFISDIEEVDGFNLELILEGKLQLDKDIKIKGNKVYSKSNCKFVSASDNTGNRPSNTCYFTSVSPEGIISNHTNREKFCRDNDLDSSTVRKMLNRDKYGKGVPYFYKDWQFFYTDGFDESMIKKKRIIRAFNLDTGEEIDFISIKDFSDKYNLTTSGISAVINGRQNKTRNWTFKIIQEGVHK